MRLDEACTCFPTPNSKNMSQKRIGMLTGCKKIYFFGGHPCFMLPREKKWRPKQDTKSKPAAETGNCEDSPVEIFRCGGLPCKMRCM